MFVETCLLLVVIVAVTGPLLMLLLLLKLRLVDCALTALRVVTQRLTNDATAVVDSRCLVAAGLALSRVGT